MKIFCFIKSRLFVFISVLLLFGCTAPPKTPSQKAKYVFFFIGDGMGLAHTCLAEAYLGAKNNKPGNQKLMMNTFPVFGSYATYAHRTYITCSAASGTAMATGHKTSKGTICMDYAHKKGFKSIATIAHEKGYKVGILTSVTINHATPAAFYAEQESRNMYYEIGEQLCKSDFEFFGGGDFNDPQVKDGISLHDKAKKADYQIVQTTDQLNNALEKKEKKVLAITPVQQENSIPYRIDNKKGAFVLSDLTKKAIEALENPNGFFIMVEGGKIDWAGHANDAASILFETLDFDDAIKVAYEFYKKHPKETLIVVGADHETGGLSVGNVHHTLWEQQKGSFLEISKAWKTLSPKESFEKTGLPFIQKYFGLHQHEKLMLSEKELKEVRKAYMKSPNDEHFVRVSLDVFQHRLGADFTTDYHTSIHIPVRAIGAGADLFGSTFDNTELFDKMVSAMQLNSDK